MDVKNILIDTLKNKFNFPVRLHGSLNDCESYPDSFFTFWNNGTVGNAQYDNKAHKCIWDFDLNFYSNDPELVNTKLMEAVDELKKKGFIADGKGYDVLSDEITHTGRCINLLYEEKER